MRSIQNLPLDEVKFSDVLPTKFGLELIADNITDQVREGNLDPLIVAVKMNALEQLSKIIRDRLQEEVFNELSKYPKGKAEILGADVSTMDTVKYDYSHLPEWAELDQQIAELTEKRKAIEDFQKKFYRGDLPVKSSTTTFKIQLAK